MGLVEDLREVTLYSEQLEEENTELRASLTREHEWQEQLLTRAQRKQEVEAEEKRSTSERIEDLEQQLRELWDDAEKVKETHAKDLQASELRVEEAQAVARSRQNEATCAFLEAAEARREAREAREAQQELEVAREADARRMLGARRAHFADDPVQSRTADSDSDSDSAHHRGSMEAPLAVAYVKLSSSKAEEERAELLAQLESAKTHLERILHPEGTDGKGMLVGSRLELFLHDLKIDKYFAAIKEIGAHSVLDLIYVEDEDIKSLKMEETESEIFRIACFKVRTIASKLSGEYYGVRAIPEAKPKAKAGGFFRF